MHIVPIAYFGSIAYFQTLVKFGEVTLEIHEHFPKQSYRNRFDIPGGEGILSMTVPVNKPQGSKTPTGKVLLSDHEDWRNRHWRAIRSAYESAPYFEHYGSMVYDMIHAPLTTLVDLDQLITQQIIDWLELPVKLNQTESFHLILDNDPRIVLTDKNSFQETEKCPYIQVFPGEGQYKRSLSVLDPLFCEGPMARSLLMSAH